MHLAGLPIAERSVPQASGLEGVVVAETRLSHVDGERGALVIAGARAEDWAFSDPGHFEIVVERLLELATGEPEPRLGELLGQARVSAFTRLQPVQHALTLPNAMDALLAATAQGCAAQDP